MLHFALVLLVASGAFAAPSVSVSVVDANAVGLEYDSGFGFNSGLARNSWALVDGGDTNVYIVYLQDVISDLGNQRDSYSQALALSQTVAILNELATGIPGDACAAASAVNTFVAGGDPRSYLSTIAYGLQQIAQLSSNPGALRYTIGTTGNCAGAGRTYQFEAAWDKILDAASPYTIGLVNEEYCAAKRLYQAFNARSNNVGAAATAAALPPVVQAVQRASDNIMNALRVIVNGGNASNYVSAAIAQLA